MRVYGYGMEKISKLTTCDLEEEETATNNVNYDQK